MFTKTNAKLLIGACLLATCGIISSGVQYRLTHPVNALRLNVMGRTEVVRHPFADGYREGDVIDFVDVDGIHYNGVVVNAVNVDTMGEPIQDATAAIQ